MWMKVKYSIRHKGHHDCFSVMEREITFSPPCVTMRCYSEYTNGINVIFRLNELIITGDPWILSAQLHRGIAQVSLEHRALVRRFGSSADPVYNLPLSFINRNGTNVIPNPPISASRSPKNALCASQCLSVEKIMKIVDADQSVICGRVSPCQTHHPPPTRRLLWPSR